nr:hypothetical protein [Frankia sp. Cj3]
MAGRAAVTSARHKLDGVAARRVLAAVTQLSNDPRPHGLRALVGEPSGVFRLRVGDCRVIYHVEEGRRRTRTAGEVASPLAGTPYDLRHAAVSTWLNAGVPPTLIAEWAGHSVAVLLHVYAKCIVGQDVAARLRVAAALGLSAAP